MIRYDKKFNAEITKAVKRYNQKINYYEKLGVYILPKKIKVSEIKKDAKTRKEIRKQLRNLEKLNAKNIREVISGGELKTLYEHKLDVQRLANAKRKITSQMKKLKVTHPSLQGIELPISFSQMGSDEYLRLKAKREYLQKVNLLKMDYKKYSKLKEQIMKIETNYINPAFKENIKEMLDSIAYYYNYPKEKRDALKQMLERISNEEFDKMFKKELSFQSIIDYYLIIAMQQGFNPYPEETEKLKDVLDNLLDQFDNIYNMSVNNA